MFTVKFQLAVFSSLFCLTSYSQVKPDSLGLPGDNFDLYGALELFKKADTPENFEKAINSNDNEVNNLDLDGDGKVDYVKVIDKKDGEAHTLVLQVAVSESETQDVAVIEVDKTGNDKAHVQIVGDEELYGKDYIVEPKEEVAQSDNTTSGQTQRQDLSNNNTNNNSVNNNNSNTTVVVNVWAWPSVQYIYGPSYAVWSSPWYWNNYPMWWQPWGPVYWRYHYRRSYRYHYPYYHRVSYYRSPRVHNWYYGRRMSAPMVQKNNQSGFYHQRQETYKSNVQPGRKYNNQPAQRNKDGMQKQELKQGNGQIRQQNASPVKEQNTSPVKEQNTSPVKQQPLKQQEPAQQQPVKQQQQPVKQQQQPVKQQQQQQQPVKQQQHQPVKQQQMQPKQQSQPKMQSAPQQRSMQSGQGGRGRGR